MLDEFALAAKADERLTKGSPSVVEAVLLHRQFCGERLTLDPNPHHCEDPSQLVIEADTTKVDRQTVFEVSDHHLENVGGGFYY